MSCRHFFARMNKINNQCLHSEEKDRWMEFCIIQFPIKEVENRKGEKIGIAHIGIGFYIVVKIC